MELRYALDEDGTIPVWLLNGPHDIQSSIPIQPPAPNHFADWTPALASGDGTIHFSQAMEADSASAYAYVEIYSGESTEAYLAIGFKSRIRIWWNGVLAMKEDFSYATGKDWRRGKIQVQKGRNTCLVQVDHAGAHEWAFTARLTDPQDHRLAHATAGLPLDPQKDPFGLKEKPDWRDPLTHGMEILPRKGSAQPAERGIFLLGNQRARAMVIRDDDAGNGLAFDFHDGNLAHGYETFIPEYSRLLVETSQGVYLCTNDVLTGKTGSFGLDAEVPGGILHATFTPVEYRTGTTCPLAVKATFFLPPDLNGVAIRVEVSNPGPTVVDGVRLHYGFITRDNRFDTLSRTATALVLEGNSGKRWLALATTHALTATTRKPYFPHRIGILPAAEKRRQRARPGVFYSGLPARNAYLRLVSSAGRLEPQQSQVRFFFITGGRTRREALEALEDSRDRGAQLLADTHAYWKHRTQPWTRLETPGKKIDEIILFSRNYLAALQRWDGYLSAGYYQSYNGAWIRDTVMCTIGMTLAGQRTEARGALEYLIKNVPPKSGQWEEPGMLLYGIWQYEAFTGDDYLSTTYTAELAATANALYQKIGDGKEKPALILSSTEGYWERPWVGEGYDLAQCAWSVIGLHKAAELMEKNPGIKPQQREGWTAAARRCQDTLFGMGNYAFIRDGRLVKRLLPDGSVQTHAPAEPGGPGKPLEPDMEVVDSYLWGLLDPHSPEAEVTTAFLGTLWNDGWTFGGAARYNVRSDPNGPTAGPWPFATLMYARALLLQDHYAEAMEMIRWVAAEDPLGYTWPERISMSAARDREARYRGTVLTWPWGSWLQLVYRECAGLYPTKKGLELNPHVPEPWAGMKLHQVRYRNAVYHIEYIGWGSRIQEIRFNGRKISGNTLPLTNGKVEVYLKPPSP